MLIKDLNMSIFEQLASENFKDLFKITTTFNTDLNSNIEYVATFEKDSKTIEVYFIIKKTPDFRFYIENKYIIQNNKKVNTKFSDLIFKNVRLLLNKESFANLLIY